MASLVPKANPYGAATERSIEKFEQRIGCQLPSDYKAYLLSRNGGKLAASIYITKGGADLKIDDFLGLHQGPDYLRLQDNFDLSNYYDLHEFKKELASYLVFATAINGDLFLMGCGQENHGAIFFFNHEVAGQITDIHDAISFLEPGFNEFVSALVDVDTFLQQLRGSPEGREFQAQLEEMKRQRERDVNKP